MQNFHRFVIWSLLLAFAAIFLAPLYVMVVTSLKDMDQIRTGGLLSLPENPTLASWATAWSSGTPSGTSSTPAASTATRSA